MKEYFQVFSFNKCLDYIYDVPLTGKHTILMSLSLQAEMHKNMPISHQSQ